ncbi:galactokinase [Malassezia nana]|uniref:Galactokinase n=1 Tax=Malassezia nana TaxID=180528 RepID=A0AAF0EL23_9BASI|nr:galactokinase [Malassezia nana]
MVDSVPVLSFPNLYSPLARERETLRWKELESKFESMYHLQPAFIARAPGRVNMIGEHIDTTGYSVFPLAIERDVLMAATYVPGPGPFRVELGNVSAQFPATSFTCDLTQPDSIELLTETAQRWANYFRVALRGLLSDLPNEIVKNAHGVLYVLVDGTVPPESSLSSSAAMTTASSLVVVTALGALDRINRVQMTQRAISSERMIGVSTGGMDQAVSVFGEMGKAVFVSFVPQLHTVPITMPKWDEYLFLVSNTLVKSDKKANASTQYNLRVAEVRMASYILRQKLNVDIPDPPQFPTSLRAVSDAYWAANPQALDEMMAEHKEVQAAYEDAGKEVAQLQAMLLLVDRLVPRQGLTLADLETLTGLSSEAIHREFLSPLPVQATHFFLHHRAFHVYAEAQRVLRFRHICNTLSTELARGEPCDVHDAYQRLGRLMNESHESLKHMYDCSCPELDDVVRIARDAGALGSRLTGAGWGGSAVHLVPRECLDAVIQSLRDKYYAVRFGSVKEGLLNDALFVTYPAQGACVVKCDHSS